MSDLFTPYDDGSVRDKSVASKYARSVISEVDITESAGSTQFMSAAISAKKLRWFIILLGTGFVLLVIRLFFLQIVQGAEYRSSAEGNRIRVEYIQSARGIIYDTNQEALVKNIPNFTITLTPSYLPKDETSRQSVLTQVANILEMPLSELKETLASHEVELYSQPLLLEEFLPYEQALSLSSQVHTLPGIAVEVRAAREYKDPEIFSHVLGYLGKITPEEVEAVTASGSDYLLTDVLGKNGLESVYEELLKGQKGKRSIEVNAVGTAIEEIAKVEPESGMNLELAIDADLQRTLYASIEEMATATQSPGGAAIAMDPRTGYIKALVSYPGFDNNAFTTGISSEDYTNLLEDDRKPLFNKTVLGEYPSGSTFKLVVASAALQDQVVTPGTTVSSTGGVQVNKWYFPDWKNGGHGQTDVRKALAESVNTYFYLAGGGSYNEETLEIEGGLGIDRIDYYAERFGLNKKTGIDLPSEATGFLPTKLWKEEVKGEPWYIGDTYNASIGQGDILVTPLQVAQFTSAVANGGTVLQPSIVEAVTDQQGVVQYRIEPIVKESQVVDSEYLRIVREGMRQAVTVGSAKRLNELPFAVAGKTGTAQIPATERTHAWFTAFAPYDNPELVITVLIEEGGEGSAAALPVAEEALRNYFLED